MDNANSFIVCEYKSPHFGWVRKKCDIFFVVNQKILNETHILNVFHTKVVRWNSPVAKLDAVKKMQ